MESPPRPNGWDLAAWVSAVGLLLVTYTVLAHRALQYGAWLAVFTIWMAWFVYYGVRWVYGHDPAAA